MTSLRVKQQKRRGLTAVAVLVCLIIITMVSGAILKVSFTHRKELRSQEQRLQAEWLAEAGIQRGIARSTADLAYNGESWEIPARELGSPDSALVTIATRRTTGDTQHVEVRAQADYPLDPMRRARVTRFRIINLDSRIGPAEKPRNQ